METIVQTNLPKVTIPGHEEAWKLVLGQLRAEMSRAMFETWVQPLRPLGYDRKVFTIGAYNPYARDWVENRLKGRITRLLEGLYQEPLSLKVTVMNGFYHGGEEDAPQAVEPAPEGETRPHRNQAPAPPEGSPRKVMLQRAYGSERARVIQPERGMFVTLYFFYNWVPLIGHSAAATILAARSMCYWNPKTGELRNVIETDMAELARRASVSVRTVKDVLNNEFVKMYFLRYKVRRIMTPNGVRTAGISLQVRMDDPLTPEDQEEHHQPEAEQWYLPEFEDERDEED
ncbi:MAG: DnaA N-terminal domain-containing protein [Anaerolineaceae bacterium]|nr:DnaA N-terminal domain-containing protein [Anaerolineaceae bacterium]